MRANSSSSFKDQTGGPNDKDENVKTGCAEGANFHVKTNNASTEFNANRNVKDMHTTPKSVFYKNLSPNSYKEPFEVQSLHNNSKIADSIEETSAMSSFQLTEIPKMIKFTNNQLESIDISHNIGEKYETEKSLYKRKAATKSNYMSPQTSITLTKTQNIHHETNPKSLNLTKSDDCTAKFQGSNLGFKSKPSNSKHKKLGGFCKETKKVEIKTLPLDIINFTYESTILQKRLAVKKNERFEENMNNKPGKMDLNISEDHSELTDQEASNLPRDLSKCDGALMHEETAIKRHSSILPKKESKPLTSEKSDIVDRMDLQKNYIDSMGKVEVNKFQSQKIVTTDKDAEKCTFTNNMRNQAPPLLSESINSDFSDFILLKNHEKIDFGLIREVSHHENHLCIESNSGKSISNNFMVKSHSPHFSTNPNFKDRSHANIYPQIQDNTTADFLRDKQHLGIANQNNSHSCCVLGDSQHSQKLFIIDNHFDHHNAQTQDFNDLSIKNTTKPAYLYNEQLPLKPKELLSTDAFLASNNTSIYDKTRGSVALSFIANSVNPIGDNTSQTDGLSSIKSNKKKRIKLKNTGKKQERTYDDNKKAKCLSSVNVGFIRTNETDQIEKGNVDNIFKDQKQAIQAKDQSRSCENLDLKGILIDLTNKRGGKFVKSNNVKKKCQYSEISKQSTVSEEFSSKNVLASTDVCFEQHSLAIKTHKAVNSDGYIGKQELEKTKQLGRFKLLDSIGSGASANVLEAICGESGEKVAIKIVDRKALSANKNEEGREKREQRIYREVIISSLLCHPHIVRLKDFYHNEDFFYLIFEYVQGTMLLDLILDKGPLNELDARRYLRQMLSALSYIHENHVVHRDLKIENILLDDQDNIKILDFGLANFYDNTRFLSTFCGSLYFAAPELLQGHYYNGPEVDIWSLGVILYVLLIGNVPFDDKEVGPLHEKIKKGEIEIPDSISKDAKNLLRGMICSDSTKRFTLSQVISSPFVTKNYSNHIENFVGSRVPVFEFHNGLVAILISVMKYQYPHFDLEFKKIKNRGKKTRKRYHNRTIPIALYHLMLDNFTSTLSDDYIETEYFETSLLKAANQAQRCHFFVNFLFSKEKENLFSTYFFGSVFKGTHQNEDTFCNIQSKSDTTSIIYDQKVAPKVRKGIFKGILKGFPVVHARNSEQCRSIIERICLEKGVFYEIDFANYTCTYTEQIHQVVFKISLYCNTLFNSFYVLLSRISGDRGIYNHMKAYYKNEFRTASF